MFVCVLFMVAFWGLFVVCLLCLSLLRVVVVLLVVDCLVKEVCCVLFRFAVVVFVCLF